MNGPIWLNLPSTNLPRAKKFYSDIGFEINQGHDLPHLVSMYVGDNRVIVNIFETKYIQDAMGGQPVTDTTKSNETIFSLGAKTMGEIDEMAKKVAAAGGTIFAEPGYKDGWYGFAFSDPDGHRWNGLYMDMQRMSKK